MRTVESKVWPGDQATAREPMGYAGRPEPRDPSDRAKFDAIDPDDTHHALLEMLSEGVLVIDGAGTVLSCNEQFASLVGLSPSFVLARGVDDYLSTRDADAIRTLFATDEPNVRRGIFALRHVDGTSIPVRISASTFSAHERRVRKVAAVFTDLRPERASLARLDATFERLEHEIDRRKKLEQRYDYALDHHATSSWAVDLSSGEAVHVMGTACLVGEANASAWSTSALIDAFVPEDREPIASSFERAQSTGGIAIEGRCSQRDSGIRWIRLDGRLLPGSSVDLDLLVCDVTWKHDYEDRLRHLADMEAMGQLAAGVAHDLGNFLHVIGNSLELLGRRAPGDPQVVRSSGVAQQALLRAAKLSQRLLTVSGAQKLQLEQLSFDRFLPSIRNLLERALPESIVLQIGLADGVWPCTTDVYQLEAAFLNLAINARDAMPDGGLVTLTVENRRVDAACAKAGGGVEGDYVVACLADNGSGMSPEIASRAFEPFFTTKAPGKGTGLGLSQVHAFAKQSNGFATIESTVGRGSRVFIFLPRNGIEPMPADIEDALTI